MDLNDMKAGWNVLNERLAQNEILNKRIIKEMITMKTKSAYDTVYRSEWQQVVLVLIIGVVISGNILLNLPVKQASFIFLVVMMSVALLFRLVLVYSLSRFSLKDMKVSELTHSIMRYKKLYWYNTKYGSAIGLGSVFVFLIMENAISNPYVIATLFALLVVAAAYSLPKLKRHTQKIREIEQGLAELKEFEDTAE